MARKSQASPSKQNQNKSKTQRINRTKKSSKIQPKKAAKTIGRGKQQKLKVKQPNKRCIWLDCDPGLDDTLALIMACRDPRLHLVGVSTSPGNTSLKNTTRNALDILYNCHRPDVKVVQGSNKLVAGDQNLAQHMHGSNGLGGVQIPQSNQKAIIVKDPFKVISTMILEASGPVTWANTGSMTNLFYLLQKYPQVKAKIQEIVIMGGAIGKGNINPSAEFNIFFDPHAAQGVFKIKGDIPLTMIPLELTHTVVAGQGVFDQLKKQKKPFAKAIHEMLTQYRRMYHNAYGNQFPYPPVHDPAVIYYILQPKQFQIKPVKVQVDTCKISYGRTNCYFSDPKNPSVPLKTIDKIGLSIKQLRKFWQLNFQLYRQIFAEDVK